MESFIENNWTWMSIMLVWSLVWKAWALWKSARAGEKVWFGALLVINTVGLLEILYIFYFSKQSPKDTDKEEK